MEFIRDLDENGKVIEPPNIRECSKMYLHCMRNVKRVDGSIEFILLEKGAFGSYESMTGIDSLSSYYLFGENMV